MKYSVFLIPILLAGMLFSACSGLDSIKDYKGDNLVINAGDTAIVKMSANTNKGFEWVVSHNSDPATAKYIGIETVSGEKKTDYADQIIKFKGLKKGKTIITLNYVKKGDLLAHKTRTVNITVY